MTIASGPGLALSSLWMFDSALKRVFNRATTLMPGPATHLAQALNSLACRRVTSWHDVAAHSSRLTRSGAPVNLLVSLSDNILGVHADIEVPETPTTQCWERTLQAAGMNTHFPSRPWPRVRNPTRCDIELGLAPDPDQPLANAYFTPGLDPSQLSLTIPSDVMSVINHSTIYALGVQHDGGHMYTCLRSPNANSVKHFAKQLQISNDVANLIASVTELALANRWPSRIGLSIRWSGLRRALRLHLPRAIWVSDPVGQLARLSRELAMPAYLATELAADSRFVPGPLWICAIGVRVDVLPCFEPTR